MKGALIVGITGGFGCGKTEVGRVLQAMGVDVIDADDIVRDLLQPGTDVYQRVVEAFGHTIVRVDRSIDRKHLARIIFSDPQQRQRLNDIVHPPVRKIWRSWVQVHRREGREGAVIIPLLFEIGETGLWDAVICVACSPELVIRRLKARGFGEGEVRSRMAAQLPLEEKCRRADYVLWNNGSVQDLQEATKRLWRRIKAERSEKYG